MDIKQKVTDFRFNVTPNKIIAARLIGWSSLAIFLFVLAAGAGAWSLIPLVLMFAAWNYVDEHRDEVGTK